MRKRVQLGSRQKRGFAMLEVIVAVGFFASVATALVVVIQQMGSLSEKIHRDQQLTRLLDSELTRTLTLPTLQEGETSRYLPELDVDLRTLVEPIEDIENQDGQPLSFLFRVQITAFFEDGGDYQSESVESWRYARLYR